MRELLVKPADLKPGDLIQKIIADDGVKADFTESNTDYIVTTVCNESNRFSYIKFDGLSKIYQGLEIPFNENTWYQIHRM